MECYQNGKRFTFRQNDDILRASSIIGGDTDGKSIERYIRCWEQWYCCYDHQYHRNAYQYRTDCTET